MSIPPDKPCNCDIKASFAVSLREWRRKHNVPLKQIAHDMGLSIATISAWENARQFPGGDNFELLVKYTGLPPCRLFCVMADDCFPPNCRLMAAKLATGKQKDSKKQSLASVPPSDASAGSARKNARRR